jgi:hypothetical protein
VKLGEALALRADMHARASQLAKAIEANATFKDGETPSEDAKALLADAFRLAEDLASMCTKINLTNAATALGKSTLTGALARRDALREKQKLLNDAIKASKNDHDAFGYSRSRPTELVTKTAFEVPALRKQLTEVTTDLRTLGNQIQQAGWATDLIE